MCIVCICPVFVLYVFVLEARKNGPMAELPFQVKESNKKKMVCIRLHYGLYQVTLWSVSGYTMVCIRLDYGLYQVRLDYGLYQVRLDSGLYQVTLWSVSG